MCMRTLRVSNCTILCRFLSDIISWNSFYFNCLSKIQFCRTKSCLSWTQRGRPIYCWRRTKTRISWFHYIRIILWRSKIRALKVFLLDPLIRQLIDHALPSIDLIFLQYSSYLLIRLWPLASSSNRSLLALDQSCIEFSHSIFLR